MFVEGVYLSVFYFLWYDTDISTYMSEEYVAEEIDPDLNDQEDIRLNEIREEHWSDVDEEGIDKKMIRCLRWEVYIKENEQLVKRDFLVSVPHPKWGEIVWTCVKDHIINEKEDYRDIGIRGFDYKLFEEEQGGGTRKVLDGYPYLKHLIQLWTGYLVRNMAKINIGVGMKNCVTMNGIGKRLVSTFKR